jgi:hypothetical protein
MHKMIHGAAEALSQAGALRVLFPLLALAGPLLFFYYGHMGVTQRRTLFLGRRANGHLGPARHIEGTSAVVYGVIYLLSGVLCVGIMWPVTLAMLGIW